MLYLYNRSHIMELNTEQFFPEINYLSYLKTVTVSILESPEMSDQFIVPQFEDSNNIEDVSKAQEIKITEVEKEDELPLELQHGKSSEVSRLEIQIKKNNFQMVIVPGQHFLLLYSAKLQGNNLIQSGHLMLTNYRLIFFKGHNKRVDLPFGLIQQTQFNEKELVFTVKLKYPHSWKFSITNPQSKFSILKNIGMVYIKPAQLKDKFCFEHYRKLKQTHKPYSYDLKQEYQRLQFFKHSELFLFCDNSKFSISNSYPHGFFIPVSTTKVMEASTHRKHKRLPILTYAFKTPHSKKVTPIWVSSAYEENKQISKKIEKQLLEGLASDSALEVYVAQHKMPKTIQESNFKNKITMNYLKLESNQELRAAECRLIQVFLQRKKPFILEVVRSGWYKAVFDLLGAVIQVRNCILSQKPVLVRCDSGWDKSLAISALTQLVLDPQFRTIKGFESLIMRMFVHNGHPFASRLGQVNNCRQICPIFLQLLDCISQILSQNQTSFQFNFKYLSQLANLMQNHLYGTFAANSPKQYMNNNLQSQTASIWNYLKTPTTINSSYIRNNGVLQFSSSTDNCRVWKQYFSTLISKKQDSYGFEKAAEDNEDYLNIATLRITKENARLREELMFKMKEVNSLKAELKMLDDIEKIQT